MTIQLALDPSTHDLIKPVGGGVSRVSDGRYTVQATKSRLKAILGEWALDESVGWLNFDDFKKGYNLFDIESRARVIILQTKGVKSISSMTSSVSNRVLTLTFKANTEYGTFDLSVPWTLA